MQASRNAEPGNAARSADRARPACPPGFSLRLCAFALSSSFAGAQADEGWSLGGHLKAEAGRASYRASDLGALYGDNPAHDLGFDLRLKAERRDGPWAVMVHYEVLALAGDSLEARRAMAAGGVPVSGSVTGLPDDRRRLLRLTDTLIDGERAAAVQRFDRLAAGYASERLRLRLGRQAVSWGNGIAFQVLDMVNPFAPLAIDKDYKTGDDMVYAQALLPGGADVQALLLPRRDATSGRIESAESSGAAKLRTRLGVFDLDLVAARHYDETLAGFGLTRSLGGAVWRLDAAHTRLTDGDGTWSVVTNIDYSWSWFGRNFYGFAEYFRNGTGERDAAGYAAPNPALAARIGRGELFTLARDYLAAGMQVELDPLVNLFGSLVWNLNDGSGIVQLRLVYDWAQNRQLLAGLNLPQGGRGEEYGGVAVPGASPPAWAAPARSLFLRAAWYF